MKVGFNNMVSTMVHLWHALLKSAVCICRVWSRDQTLDWGSPPACSKRERHFLQSEQRQSQVLSTLPGHIFSCAFSLWVWPFSTYYVILFIPVFTGFTKSTCTYIFSFHHSSTLPSAVHRNMPSDPCGVPPQGIGFVILFQVKELHIHSLH